MQLIKTNKNNIFGGFTTALWNINNGVIHRHSNNERLGEMTERVDYKRGREPIK